MLPVMAKRKRTTSDLTPGTPAGDAYLDRQDAVRRRAGFHGRTIKGPRGTTSYGSTVQQRAQSRGKNKPKRGY